jgi:hypothetical protein
MLVSFIVMHRAGNDREVCDMFYVWPANIMHIDYCVINYEISVSMGWKMFALNIWLIS